MIACKHLLMKEDMRRVMCSSDETFLPFTIEELKNALKTIKPCKASGLDGISPEMAQHFGPETREWLLTVYNICATGFTLPKILRKAKVVAVLKPG